MHSIVQLKTDYHLLQRLGLADERKSQDKLAKEQLKELSSSAVLLSAIQALPVTHDTQDDYSTAITADSFDGRSDAPSLSRSEGRRVVDGGCVGGGRRHGPRVGSV